MTSTIVLRVKPFIRVLQNHKCRPNNIQAVNLAHLRNLVTSSPTRSSIQIDVTPKEALMDNPPVIRVEGLNKNQQVTLWNTFTDDSGFEFSSHAHYIADGNGVVDVRNHMSYGGKYKGIFTEGLVCSLHAAPPVYKDKAHLKWARLFKRNVTEPMKYTLNVIDGHVSEGDLYSKGKPESLGETQFIRHLMAEGVKRIEVEGNNIRGCLFLPPGEGPFPVVLDLFGAEPGIKEFRSAMLSAYGYATMVLPYYSYKDLPPLSNKLNLEYFLEGIDYLNSLPQASKKGIGLIGSSKGGEIGLLLCGLTDKIKACITVNAYNVSVDVDFYYNKELYFQGRVGNKENMNILFTKKGQFIAFGFEDLYTRDYRYILPLKKCHDDCEIMLAAGDQDSGHAHRSAIALWERAKHFNKENVSTMVYAGAGHLLDPPFHSHIEAVWNASIPIRKADDTKHMGMPHFYGGTPYGCCQGMKDLWKRTIALFHKRLVQDAGLPIQITKLPAQY